MPEEPPELGIHSIEVENLSEDNLSFELWCDRKAKKCLLRIGKSGKFILELPKGKYRREALITAYKKE